MYSPEQAPDLLCCGYALLTNKLHAAFNCPKAKVDQLCTTHMSLPVRNGQETLYARDPRGSTFAW